MRSLGRRGRELEYASPITIITSIPISIENNIGHFKSSKEKKNLRQVIAINSRGLLFNQAPRAKSLPQACVDSKDTATGRHVFVTGT